MPPDFQSGMGRLTSRQDFAADFRQVKTGLAQGDFYQINLTSKFKFRCRHPLRFFISRLGASPPPYAAYISFGESIILSWSPELLLAKQGSAIVSKPMKGTATILESKQALHSQKSEAENLMIVDMVRNDLGRVAVFGSVQVPRLFQIESHGALYQMTSTVTATTTASWEKLFEATFPPASVTGAPKIAAVQAIADLENEPRGVYCGAIGWIAPNGDGQFSVAIRTATVNRLTGEAEYGYGSGLVWDSDEESEWKEWESKLETLTIAKGGWQLVESIPFGSTRVYLHKERMRRSATELGIPFDDEAFETTWRLAQSKPAKGKVRVTLDQAGVFNFAVEDSWYQGKTHLTAALAHSELPALDPSLHHKTNNRGLYQRFKEELAVETEEVLLHCNGLATEFCGGALLVKRGDTWVTPKLNCLPSIGAEIAGATPADIPIEEALSAQQVHFVNAIVRLPVTIVKT